MSFTEWEALWGSSLWGGICDYILPVADPIGGPDGPAITSALYLAQDGPSINDEANGPFNIIGGDSLGWAPRNMDSFSEAGNITCVATTAVINFILTHEFWFIRGDWSGRVARVTGQTDGAGVVHGEMFGHTNITGLGGKPHPAFVFFSLDGSNNLQAYNMPLSDSTSLNQSTVWDNELGVTLEQCRFASMETHGTVVCTVGPSGQFPGQQSFYMKSTFGSGSAAPAVELIIDLRPADGYTLDLTDFHVVETHNRVFLFYYTVIDAAGDIHTAHFAYTPAHNSYDADLPFSVEGVVRPPRVIVTGLKPIKAPKGARRHPVSNEIIIGLEPVGTVNGDEIQWHLTRGYGDILKPNPDIWNADNHAYLFGGRLKENAPDREISILSVGWADPRHGGIFPITATLKFGQFIEPAIDFENTYLTTQTSAFASKLRLCLGNLYLPREPDDSNPGGSHQLVGGRVASMEHNETARVGYSQATDFLQATNILELDDVQQAGLTVAKLGGNGTVEGGVTPTQGIVKGALYLYDAAAKITIPSTPAMDAESIAVSIWVYPELAGRQGETEYTIVSRTSGAVGYVWRLFWEETGQEFHWNVECSPGGGATITSASIGSLPEKHWYHVTATYDLATTRSQLFINGFLVDENFYVAGSLLDYDSQQDRDIVLGRDSVSLNPIKGRLDDFVHGTHMDMQPQRVVAAFHYGLLGPSGPMRVSRVFDDPELQDKIVATAMHEAFDQGTGVYYTFALRKVAITSVAGLEHQAVIDVWRNDRTAGGGGPQYTGMIPPPWWTLDHRTAYPSDGMRGHKIEDPVESFEMKVSPVSLLAEPGKLGIYFVLREPSGAQAERSQLLRAVCNPDNPALDIASASLSYDLVAQFDSGRRVTAFDVAVRSTSDAPVVVVAARETTVSNKLYIARKLNWGSAAVGTVNSINVAALMPPTNAGGSFEGRDYNTAYTTSGIGPTIRGLITREIVPGSGMPDLVHTGFQVIFGVQSYLGGTAIPANAPQEQMVSTLHVIIPPEAIDSLVGGDFPLVAGGEPRQLDEYEEGGIDPFIPLRFIAHPDSTTGDVFVLGRTGNRAQTVGRDGNGGLALFRTKAQGNWSMRLCCMAGLDWGPSESVTVGASACLSTITAEGVDPVVVHVSRMHPSRGDKFSTIYVSAEEAESGGWDPPVPLEVTPVLRRNDRMSSLVWLDYKLNTRGFTDEPTGPKIIIGDRYKYAINLRWSLPGSTQDPTPQ